jgi:hypothetical protein
VFFLHGTCALDDRLGVFENKGGSEMINSKTFNLVYSSVACPRLHMNRTAPLFFFNNEKRFQLSLQISYGLIITKLQTPRKYQSRPIAWILQELATYSIAKSPFMVGKNLHDNCLHLLICHSKRLLILIMSLHWSRKPKSLEKNLQKRLYRGFVKDHFIST